MGGAHKRLANGITTIGGCRWTRATRCLLCVVLWSLSVINYMAMVVSQTSTVASNVNLVRTTTIGTLKAKKTSSIRPTVSTLYRLVTDTDRHLATANTALAQRRALINTHTHTYTHLFSGTTRISRCQKGKTNLDFTEGEIVSGSGVSWPYASLHLAPDR